MEYLVDIIRKEERSMYNFKKIEKKWQKYWEEEGIYKAKNDYNLPKQYNLVEFPYPSGVGIKDQKEKMYYSQQALIPLDYQQKTMP